MFSGLDEINIGTEKYSFLSKKFQTNFYIFKFLGPSSDMFQLVVKTHRKLQSKILFGTTEPQ